MDFTQNCKHFLDLKKCKNALLDRKLNSVTDLDLRGKYVQWQFLF